MCGSTFHREETAQRKVKLPLLPFWHCCGYRRHSCSYNQWHGFWWQRFPHGLSRLAPWLLIADYSSTFLDGISSNCSVPWAWCSLFLIIRPSLSAPDSPGALGLRGGWYCCGSATFPRTALCPQLHLPPGRRLRIVPYSLNCCRRKTDSEKLSAAEGHRGSPGLKWRARGSSGASGALWKHYLLSAHGSTSERRCGPSAGGLTGTSMGSLRTRWQLDLGTRRNWALPNAAVRRKVLFQWHSNRKMKRARNERERRDGVSLCHAVSW